MIKHLLILLILLPAITVSASAAEASRSGSKFAWISNEELFGAKMTACNWPKEALMFADIIQSKDSVLIKSVLCIGFPANPYVTPEITQIALEMLQYAQTPDLDKHYINLLYASQRAKRIEIVHATLASVLETQGPTGMAPFLAIHFKAPNPLPLISAKIMQKFCATDPAYPGAVIAAAQQAGRDDILHTLNT